MLTQGLVCVQRPDAGWIGRTARQHGKSSNPFCTTSCPEPSIKTPCASKTNLSCSTISLTLPCATGMARLEVACGRCCASRARTTTSLRSTSLLLAWAYSLRSFGASACWPECNARPFSMYRGLGARFAWMELKVAVHSMPTVAVGCTFLAQRRSVNCATDSIPMASPSKCTYLLCDGQFYHIQAS